MSDVPTVGSLFSGLGALELAVEEVFGARTVWQVEHEARARGVLAHHWPEADRSVWDVCDPRTVAPGRRVDLLCGGFPCQDLSVANPDAKGLDGERSGLFYALAGAVRHLRPELVVIENVPALETWRAVVERELAPYGCSWIRFSATTAGAPHLRRRVLVVARRDGRTTEDLDLTVSPKEWAAQQASGEQVRCWPTATATDYKSAGPGQRRGQLGEAVGEAERLWPTALASDAKEAATHGPAGTVALCKRVREHSPGRLHPAWVECLMGLPVGWTASIDRQLGLFGSPAEARSQRDAAVALLRSPRWLSCARRGGLEGAHPTGTRGCGPATLGSRPARFKADRHPVDPPACGRWATRWCRKPSRWRCALGKELWRVTMDDTAYLALSMAQELERQLAAQTDPVSVLWLSTSIDALVSVLEAAGALPAEVDRAQVRERGLLAIRAISEPAELARHVSNLPVEQRLEHLRHLRLCWSTGYDALTAWWGGTPEGRPMHLGSIIRRDLAQPRYEWRPSPGRLPLGGQMKASSDPKRIGQEVVAVLSLNGWTPIDDLGLTGTSA